MARTGPKPAPESRVYSYRGWSKASQTAGDSRRRQQEENLASFQDLHEQLATHGIDPRGMPMVLQYNKQDLPRELILAPEEMSESLNFREAPEFAADALGGVNVFETMRAACALVLKRIASGAAAAA